MPLRDHEACTRMQSCAHTWHVRGGWGCAIVYLWQQPVTGPCHSSMAALSRQLQKFSAVLPQAVCLCLLGVCSC